MSFQLYCTRLKCLFRNRENMFWCYMFPILLATCFFFAFNNLYKVEDFETIQIAYDNEGQEADAFKELLSTAKMSDDKLMFDITYCDKTKAKQLLENGNIEAYIVGSENPMLYVKENGLNETIIKSFLDNYKQMSGTVETILKENPNAIKEGLLDDVMQYKEFIDEVKSDKNPDSLLIYFYSLMAYTCIFAANWGLDEVANIQANLSGRGARMSVSSINKMKLFVCNLLAAFTAQLGSMILLFLYMFYIIKVDFGENLGYLLIICLIGSFTGLALGGTVGVWVKKKAEVKEAILTLIVLGGGFLSGMMIADMKVIIAEKFPLLGYINPVNLVADAMYSLYYFDTYDRFYLDVVILGIITVVLCIASYVGIRRKNYASI
ncbi:MAG: ABC transporter permease [Herbinix sp.]|nr:ABC transporter permease [Herbinix sp.]